MTSQDKHKKKKKKKPTLYLKYVDKIYLKTNIII